MDKLNSRFTSGLTSEQLRKFGERCRHCGQPYGRHAAGSFACPKVPHQEADPFERTRFFAGELRTVERAQSSENLGVIVEGRPLVASAQHPKLGCRVKVTARDRALLVGHVVEVVPNAKLPQTPLRHTADKRRDSARLCRDHESYVISTAPLNVKPTRANLLWPKVSQLSWSV